MFVRVRQAAIRAWDRAVEVGERFQAWVDGQDPASRKGAGIGWYRRFRESDGGLLAVLISAHFFVTAIPAAVVMMGYVYNDPTELADRLAAAST